MLVLSRKSGQELVIDGRIRIVIRRISGSRVTLSVDAPHEVHVRRGELPPLSAAFEPMAIESGMPVARSE